MTPGLNCTEGLMQLMLRPDRPRAGSFQLSMSYMSPKEGATQTKDHASHTVIAVDREEGLAGHSAAAGDSKFCTLGQNRHFTNSSAQL